LDTKESNHEKSNIKIKNRIIIWRATFILLLAILMVRVAFIQIINNEWYEQKAFAQQNTNQILSANRGRILDRNGKELAISAKVSKIICDPIEVRKSDKNLSEIAQDLAKILKIDSKEIESKFQRDTNYAEIKSKVEKEDANLIIKYSKNDDVRGIYTQPDTKRYYPNDNLAAHVIGFTGRDDQGLYGIEKMMDRYLKGVPGKILSEVDGNGTVVPFNEEKKIEPQDGLDVHLTIDESIQHIVQEELEIAIEENEVLNGAVGIVIEPSTGDILAMVSKPDFDLNLPNALPIGFDIPNWNGTTSKDIRILEETVWRNKAVSDTYEPGSTFKAITTAAGLEEAVVMLETPTDDYTITVSGAHINCWKPNGHGHEPFYVGVYNSCNPVFVKVAQDLKIQRFYKYIRTFGFYEKTGINLPGEAAGVFHEHPTELDMAVASFGQRFQITPIQLSMAYGAIINGGKLMKPRLVTELTNQRGVTIKKFEPEIIRTSISQKTSDTVREILEGVVAEGTGKNAYVIGYRVGGKTGTSETIDEDRYIASFSGFAPADNPQIHVLVILDYPNGDSYYGGQIAAPVAGNIIEKTLRYMGIERKYTKKDLEIMPEEVSTPNLKGKTIKEARELLKEIGLQYTIEKIDENDIIMKQVPVAGKGLEKKSIVVLYTYDTEGDTLVNVPDVSHMTIDDAILVMKRARLNIRTKGVGRAVKQSKEPDTAVPIGSIIDVNFKYLDTD
jgi:stage V sporulation protein D (sporulation-specific penicillin-binding protein)